MADIIMVSIAKIRVVFMTRKNLKKSCAVKPELRHAPSSDPFEAVRHQCHVMRISGL